MLSSIGIQTFSIVNNQSLFQPKTSKIPKNPSIHLKSPNKKNLKPLAISASSPSSSPSVISNRNEEREKMKVVVKAIERPRLVLKFIWMEKNIGIAVDQLIPGGGGGTIPVSPYYFWPRKDAWEELKVMMETKPWISNTQKVFLLNQATDIINLWQATGHG